MADKAIRTAVVTGGHGYDVPALHELFRGLNGIDPCIQHMDDFASSSEEIRDGYDVVLFYSMLKDTPEDEGQPWYCGKPRTALERLGSTTQGVLVLHHAILAYPEWQLWNDIVGIDNREFGFHIGEDVHIDVTSSDHPITDGVTGWSMIDETYTMDDAGDGSEILLTMEHEKSMKTIGWTRQHKNSRVFCFQSGHDAQTWTNRSFQQVLARGIEWCAGVR